MEADEPEVNVQAFSTARDEYVSNCSFNFGTRFDIVFVFLVCCIGQAAAA